MTAVILNIMFCFQQIKPVKICVPLRQVGVLHCLCALKTQESESFPIPFLFLSFINAVSCKLSLSHMVSYFTLQRSPLCGGIQKEAEENKGGMFLPFEISGRIYWRIVKGSRALPVWHEVDRLENKATIQKHPGRLAKMTNSWGRITPNTSIGQGSLLEEECGSCWTAELCPDGCGGYRKQGSWGFIWIPVHAQNQLEMCSRWFNAVAWMWAIPAECAEWHLLGRAPKPQQSSVVIAGEWQKKQDSQLGSI